MAWTHVIANRGKPPFEWDPRDPPERPDFAYLGGVAAAAEAALPNRALTLIVTTDHRVLPRYGRDVAVIQRAGPDGRPPEYATRVLAVFKTHSAQPVLAIRPRREPWALTATSLARYVQLLALGLPARLRSRGATLEPIPLGVMWSPEVAVRPVAERPVDVLFCGSVETIERTGWRGRVGTPKTHARRAMVAAVNELSGARVDIGLTPSFAASKHAGADAYWARLADAKICLVPRGDTLETYRLFEAARAGCVLVGERLPSNWFSDPLPMVDATGFGGLDATLAGLLADPAGLAERQRRTLEWWERVAAPEPVGRHVAATLEGLS